MTPDRLSSLDGRSAALPARPESSPVRWREVWVAAAILLGLAAVVVRLLTQGSPPPEGYEDYSAWAYLWLVVTPILAAVSMGIMDVVAGHAVRWASWEGPFTPGRLMTVAVALSSVSALAIMSVLEVAFPSILSDAIYGAVVIALPVAVGIATVVVPLWWRHRRR